MRDNNWLISLISKLNITANIKFINMEKIKNDNIKHFKFSDRIPSKYITFKILGYYDYDEDIVPVNALCRGLTKLINSK